MINSVGLSLSSSANSPVSKPLTYSQLFELKASRVRDEYLKNRGCPTHYRNWVSLLASAHRWDALREVILTYRHDAPEFDAINAFYLSNQDRELTNDSNSAFEMMMLYHLSYPEDIECILILARLCPDDSATVIEKNRFLNAIRTAFKNDSALLFKEYKKELTQYEWIKEFALFKNPKHMPSRMDRVPIYVFLEILNILQTRSNQFPIPAIDEEIPKQIRENPFNIRLISFVLIHYIDLKDLYKSEHYYKILIEFSSSPSHIVKYALSKYEIFRGDKHKAQERLSDEKAQSIGCCIMRLNLLSSMGLTDEWIRVFEKYDALFHEPKAFDSFRMWHLERKLKVYCELQKYECVEESVNKLLKMSPQNSKAYHALVLASLQTHKYKEAWNRFDKKVKSAPSDVDPLLGALIAKRSYDRLKETEQLVRNNLVFTIQNNSCNDSLVDLLVCQSKYEEAFSVLSSISNLDELQKIKGEIIRFRLKMPPSIPLDQLKKCALLDYFLAEMRAEAGDYESAIKLFGNISLFEDIDTLNIYLRSLMALGKIQEAKDFLNRLDDNRKLRLRGLRVQIEQAKVEIKKETSAPKKIIAPQIPQYEEIPKKVMIGMTPNAISLLKEKVTRKPCCGNDGVDPIIYSNASRIKAQHLEQSQAINTHNYIYYTDSYCIRIRTALNLLERFKDVYKEPQTRENAYLLIYYLTLIFEQLSPLNPNPDHKAGMNLFSQRVVSTDLLSAIRSNLVNLPALISDIAVFKFAKSFIESGFEHSVKMSFSEPEPLKFDFTSFSLENGETWESLKDHIQVVLHFEVIRNELAFMAKHSSTYLSKDDPHESLIPYQVSAERIRSSIDFIKAFDPPRGDKLMMIFREVDPKSNATFDYSLDNLNRLMALAKLKSQWLEKV